jgi:hypothetical protein
MATARRALAGAGTQTAGLAMGGTVISVFSPSAATEEFTGAFDTATASILTTS